MFFDSSHSKTLICWSFCTNLSYRKTLILQKQYHMDAKDILGLPKNGPLMSQEKKSRPQKESQRKPDGISREVSLLFLLFFLILCIVGLGSCWFPFLGFQVYALTGGIAPLMPSIDINQLKKRALSESEKVHLLNFDSFYVLFLS